MASFFEANRVRLSLKMKLSMFYWYSSSYVVSEKDGYSITVCVKKINNLVKKTIPPVINSVSIRTILE